MNAAPTDSSRPRRRRWVRGLVLRLAVVSALVGALSVSGCIERLFYHPTAELTPAPSGVEKVTFTSADGTSLVGWFIPASGPGAETPGPAILHAHGNAGNIRDHVYFTEYLPAAGFHVFIFDYRGYGESEGSAARRNDLIADTTAALDALLARPGIDPARIGLYGQSLGGSIGIHVAAERSEIRAAVLESAFTSWQDAAASAVGGAEPGWLARFLAWVLIRDHRRADEALAQFQRPTLLLHGTADTIVPVTHSRRLKESGGSHTTLIEYEGGQHNTLRDTHPAMDQAVIEFFRQHLR